VTGDEFDVVIAGAGAGGGFAAMALTEAGARVLLLERGNRFDFALDFPVQSYVGPPLDSRIWDFSAPAAGGTVKTGYILGPGGGLQTNGPVEYARSIGGFGGSRRGPGCGPEQAD
jgi:flavin-dependent dehydrogenase